MSDIIDAIIDDPKFQKDVRTTKPVRRWPTFRSPFDFSMPSVLCRIDGPPPRSHFGLVRYRYYSPGEMLKRSMWGTAWLSPSSMTIIEMPIPLNVIARAIREAYLWCAFQRWGKYSNLVKEKEYLEGSLERTRELLSEAIDERDLARRENRRLRAVIGLEVEDGVDDE